MTHQALTLETAEQVEENGFIRVSLNPKIQMLLPTEHLTEIIRLKAHKVIPIPDVASSVLGVCEWRSEVLWLVALAKRLDCKFTQGLEDENSEYSILIYTYQGMDLGLVVEQVQQVETHDVTQIVSTTEQLSIAEAAIPYISGVLPIGKDQFLPILACESLLKSFHPSA